MNNSERSMLPVWTPDGNGVAAAAQALLDGDIVAIPTETVYGLAGIATNDLAIASIFEAKDRPQFNPLIIHFFDQNEVWEHVCPSPTAKVLADTFWPGPLTLVLPRQETSNVSLLAGAGLPTLAVRVPAHPTARLLLMTVQTPLAAPSANMSGTVSPTRAEHVIESFTGKISGVLDGGNCTVGLESTVIGFDDETPVLLRSGGTPQEDIEAAVGSIMVASPDSEVSSPGMLKRHYAPNTPLRLNADDTIDGEVMLGFGADLPANAPPGSLNLSPVGDVREAAANVFSMLRDLDRLNSDGIAVMPIPDEGLGRAINDRLRRAMSPN